MSHKQPITVSYNIPRFTVATPGRQNRTLGGNMFISPGMTEALEFQYINVDGVPINLVGFTLKLVFWYDDSQYESITSDPNGNIVLAKQISSEQVYEGIATVLLTDHDTLTLGTSGRLCLRWSIFMINTEGQIFPTQVTSDGRRYGICQIDNSGLPITDVINGLTISVSLGE